MFISEELDKEVMGMISEVTTGVEVEDFDPDMMVDKVELSRMEEGAYFE